MLDVLLSVNNFIHDFASGLWLATLLVLYLLYRYTVGEGVSVRPLGRFSTSSNNKDVYYSSSERSESRSERVPSPSTSLRINPVEGQVEKPEAGSRGTLPRLQTSRSQSRDPLEVVTILRKIFNTIFILFLASLAVIILTGIVRLLIYDYYTTRVVTVTFGLTKTTLLIAKHILLITIYGTGTYLAFHLRQRLSQKG